MSKYILIHGQFHEIPDDALMHWKYIKREKVNGKWKYYYDNDKLGIKNFIDTKITGKAYKQHYQEATDKQIKVGQERFSTSQQRAHAEQTSKGFSKTDPEVVRLTKQERALDEKYNSLNNEASEAKANYYNKSAIGSIKKNVKGLKNAVNDSISTAKDKLGVDERAEYRETKRKYEIAVSNFNDAAREKDKKISIYDYDQERMVPHNTKYWGERVNDLGKEYIDVRLDYMNTPLGKAARVTTTIKNLVDEMLTGLKKSRVPEPKLSNIGTENVIKENVIKENVLEEDKIYEDVIDANGNRVKKRKKR